MRFGNNSIKQAISCNLPIVSTNCGDAKERLLNIKNSFVSDSFDASTIAEEAIKILEKGERSNGRKFADIFSKENVARQVIAVYKKALST